MIFDFIIKAGFPLNVGILPLAVLIGKKERNQGISDKGEIWLSQTVTSLGSAIVSCVSLSLQGMRAKEELVHLGSCASFDGTWMLFRGDRFLSMFPKEELQRNGV